MDGEQTTYAPRSRAPHSNLDRGSVWAGHVAKIVKGLLVALAAVVVLDWSADPGTASITIIGAVIAVLVGDVYAEFIQREIQARRRLARSEIRAIGLGFFGIPLGAAPAFVLFVLAWTGLVDTELALDISVWGGVALLGGLGYAAGRLRGESALRSLQHAGMLACIGLVVLILKTAH